MYDTGADEYNVEGISNQPPVGSADPLYKPYFSDQSTVTIPEHLKWREPKIKNEFKHVESRYLRPKKNALSEVKESFHPKITPFAQSLESRYMAPREKPEIPKDETGKYSKEYEEIKRYARSCGVANPEPRFMPRFDKEEGVETPRDVADRHMTERRRYLVKDGKPFVGSPKYSLKNTFEDVGKDNKDLCRWSMPKQSKGESKVSEYVRNKLYVPSDSPRREHREPTIGGKRFVPAGGCGGGNSFRRSDSSMKPSFMMMEEKIMQMRERRSRTPPVRGASERLSPHPTASPRYSRAPSQGSVNSPRGSPQRFIRSIHGTGSKSGRPHTGGTSSVMSSESFGRPTGRAGSPAAAPLRDARQQAEIVLGPASVFVPQGSCVRITDPNHRGEEDTGGRHTPTRTRDSPAPAEPVTRQDSGVKFTPVDPALARQLVASAPPDDQQQAGGQAAAGDGDAEKGGNSGRAEDGKGAGPKVLFSPGPPPRVRGGSQRTSPENGGGVDDGQQPQENVTAQGASKEDPPATTESTGQEASGSPEPAEPVK